MRDLHQCEINPGLVREREGEGGRKDLMDARGFSERGGEDDDDEKERKKRASPFG